MSGNLEISIIDMNKTITINGKSYHLDLTKPKWRQMLDWSAELTSGMVLKSYKDQNGDDINEITLTKEYAIKKNNVTTEIIKVLFSLDIDVDDIDVDTMFEMVEIVNESGFLERLERLSKGNSTPKKNTNK